MISSAEMSHLSERAKCVVSLPDNERISYLTKWMWIYSETAEQIEHICRRMLSINHPSQAPCLLVIGPSGIGKTSLMGYLQQHVFPKNRSVIFFDSRRCLTYKSFLLKFAQQLNIGVSEHSRQTCGELEVELDTACRLCGLKCLIVDNIHDLMRGSRNDQRNVLTFLRELSASNHPVSLFCFAVDKFAIALRSDEQLEGRFTVYSVPLWKSNAELVSFLCTLESELPLKKPSDLASAKKIEFLLQHSGGITKKIVEAIKHAAIAAITSQQEKITLDSLRLGGRKPFQQSNWNPDE